MATAKKTPIAAKKSVAVKTSAKPAAKAAAAPLKPIKEAFNRTSLIAHLATQSGAEPKVVKSVMAALEAAITPRTRAIFFANDLKGDGRERRRPEHVDFARRTSCPLGRGATS